jgi:hypothetical protein
VKGNLRPIALLLIATTAVAANPSRAAANPTSAKAVGTVNDAASNMIAGEQDSAMGLNLTPWKEEYATGMDQPPSLYRAATNPIDSRSLRRQTEYRDTLGSYRRSHSQYTP